MATDVGLDFQMSSTWNGGFRPECATHYVLTLEQNFWGINTAGNFSDLTEIGVMGHGCFAVRR